MEQIRIKSLLFLFFTLICFITILNHSSEFHLVRARQLESKQ